VEAARYPWPALGALLVRVGLSVARRASITELQHAAIVSGMRTLRDEGIRLCMEGVTTTEEVRRVAGA
jgi:type II secretory ATPase GspE/PulE/Tfp pilus assembly ATPase PilB-like protein